MICIPQREISSHAEAGISMSSDQTRTAILTAAEKLWSERSFGEVTMRDIVSAAGVNLAAVNYHFGSKDELLAELFVSRTTVLNRERFAELKAAEEAGGGKASVEAILHALVGPPLRWCLNPDLHRSAAARFMTRASVETVPPIKKIVDREFRHLQRFATALRTALPHRDEVDIYWGLHFALAMIRQTVTDSERLRKLSGGLCDLNDTDDIIRRIVAAAQGALIGETRAPAATVRATAGRKS
jgi:AcrR family transcriptional regulator